MRPLHAFTRGASWRFTNTGCLSRSVWLQVLLSVLVGVLTGAVLLTHNTTSYQRALYKDYLVAEFRASITFGDPSKLTQTFTYPGGRVQEIRSLEFLRNSWVKRQIQSVDAQLQRIWRASLWTLLLATLLTISFFILSGYRTYRKKLERGNQVVSPKILKRLIRKAQQASDLTLDGLPLLKNKETSHILITGTTGSGKTNCFHTLLPQIRRRPNRAVIVDLTGDY